MTRTLRWYDRGIWFRLRHALFGYCDGPTVASVDAEMRPGVVQYCALCGRILRESSTHPDYRPSGFVCLSVPRT